jgi:GTP-binding protein
MKNENNNNEQNLIENIQEKEESRGEKYIPEKFVDFVKVFVKGGDGGDGAIAFLREKFKPKGGPAGGDGGKGGNVIFVATSQKSTLIDFKYKKHLIAQNGEKGKGKNQKGKDGEDLIVFVPVGTVIKDAETGEILCDLDEDGKSFVAARGGRGGRGNSRFATPTNQAPRFAEKGEPGERKWLILELKLLADVGIVGLPNAGKSSLIRALTRARPKVADYPFTTLTPQLGILEIDDLKICVADIPGIIEGAHKGLGLGLDFLRHIQRTSILVFVIDLAREDIKPDRAFEILKEEIKNYDAEILKKPKIIVGNKIDLLKEDEIKNWEKYFSSFGLKFIPISALHKINIDELKKVIAEEIKIIKEMGKERTNKKIVREENIN